MIFLEEHNRTLNMDEVLPLGRSSAMKLILLSAIKKLENFLLVIMCNESAAYALPKIYRGIDFEKCHYQTEFEMFPVNLCRISNENKQVIMSNI